MQQSCFASPSKKVRSCYKDVVALIKHINSTPVSRKQEQAGVFWT